MSRLHSVDVQAQDSALDAMHGLLARVWSDWLEEAADTMPDAAWQAAFATALGEVVGNVVRHAYESGTGPVRIRVRRGRDRLIARITDRGIAYPGHLAPGSMREVATLESLDDLEALLAIPESGYGLDLARAMTDLILYRRHDSGINTWRVVKLVKAPPPADSQPDR